MEELKRYRVTGVSKSTGADAQVEFDALNEANARVKAELRQIVVTSVEQITLPSTQSPAPAIFSPEPMLPIEPQPVQDNQRRRRSRSVPAAIGWVVFALAVLAAIGQWVGPNHRRDSSIEAVMQGGDSHAIAGSIGFLLGNNVLGVIAAILGLTVFFISRRTAGRALLILSLVTIIINTVGQLRPTSESLAGTGLTTTTTIQAKQAAKDLSRMFDRVVPAHGEAPAADSNTIVSTNIHGELAHLINVAQDLLTGMFADATEYQAGVLSLRLDSILLPMRLDSAAEINGSKSKIASAKRLFDKYDAAVRARMKAARDGLTSAPYAPSVREGLIRNFDKGMTTTMPQIEKILSYESEMYAELTVLLDFMLTQQGKFQQVGNQLKFDDAADATTYNASLTRYQAIAIKQAALRELMQESARAYADRLRRAADTGSFDNAPSMLEAAGVRPMRIDLSPDGPRINGAAVTFPITVAELSALLGQPSRTVTKVNTIRVWDSMGIYAYSNPDSQDVDSIAIVLNKQHGYDFSPTNVFDGGVVLAAIEVCDIDTPRSLNRRLKGIAFRNLDPLGFNWDIHFPTYSVEMSVDKSGLSDTITIRGPKSE